MNNSTHGVKKLESPCSESAARLHYLHYAVMLIKVTEESPFPYKTSITSAQTHLLYSTAGRGGRLWSHGHMSQPMTVWLPLSSVFLARSITFKWLRFMSILTVHEDTQTYSEHWTKKKKNVTNVALCKQRQCKRLEACEHFCKRCMI